MSGDLGSLFFGSDNHKRERVYEPCAEVHYYKCAPAKREDSEQRGCGRNIPVGNRNGWTVRCDNCGKVWSVVNVNWSGKKP